METTELDRLRLFARNALADAGKARTIAEHRLGEAETALVALDAEQLIRKAKAERLRMAAAGLQTLLDAIAAKNLAKVEDLVNTALRSVIHDHTIEFKLVSEVKRNVNTYRIALVQNGMEGNIDSYGGGVVALCAVVLKLIFNRFAGRYPLIALDESLSFLADKYVDAASALLKDMSRQFDMPILLVTHNPQFRACADRVIEAVRKDDRTTVYRERSADEAFAA
jgi:DNA repair exonuclease SbcCD ATPase subunit